MAVAFGAVGPGATGTTTTASTLTWTHTIGAASSPVLLAAGSFDLFPDTSGSLAATCAGTPMTALLTVHANAQTYGFITVFGITSPVAGANTIVLTATGSPNNMTGGSLSFSGAMGFGTPASAAGSGSTNYTTATGPSLANTSGSIIAGFAVAGHSFSSATSPSTSRFRAGTSSTGAGGFCAGATTPATGSSIAMAWTISSGDYFGVIQAEVLAAAGLNTAGGSYQTFIG